VALLLYPPPLAKKIRVVRIGTQAKIAKLEYGVIKQALMKEQQLTKIGV